MSQLTVYKASAGSGKTFRLTVEYLKFLLSDPEAYRGILAVTFTNKATGEMKERVLEALYELMHLQPGEPLSGIPETLCRETGLKPEEAAAKASLSMQLLLHDYGRFRIETIDSFFQSVLRNLARELGLGAWFNVELDNASVLNEAVDNLMDHADRNPELLEWITAYMQEMVDQGSSWKIDAVLKKFGMTVFQEYFKEKESILEEKLKDKSFLKRYRKELRAIEQEARAQLTAQSDRFFDLLETNGLVVDDFSNKARGPVGYFLKIRQGQSDDELLNTSAQNVLDDPTRWATAKSENRALICLLGEEQLSPLLRGTETLRARLHPLINSARMASAHLNQVGLLSDIAAEIRTLNLENNRFLLSDTNALLQSLLSNSDASFVYEKTGTEVKHILFDEFQDTSRMQWNTFKPLLAEGLANGYDSLIVGDEKQSIYRWRNGDWRILGRAGNEMKPAVSETKVLDHNWRSERNIIEFNNLVFRKMENRLSAMHLERFNEESLDLKRAYADVEQLTKRASSEGLVDVSFISSTNNNSYLTVVLDRMIQKIEELQRAGIPPSQIAILIRVNKAIPLIGEFISRYKESGKADPNVCYDIVSDEAFQLKTSRAVQILMDALRLLNDPRNPIPQALLKLDYLTDVQAYEGDLTPVFRPVPKNQEGQASQKTAYRNTFIDTHSEASLLPETFTLRFEALQRLPLYELVEELYRIFELERIPEQDSHLFCFMDKLAEYLLHGSPDLRAFLEYWDEELCNAKIAAGNAVNGIRILSIHKSKGLEFHTVLLPFCDWKLLDHHNSKIWCQTDVEPFSQLDLIPVNYHKEMAQSCFREAYQEETLQLWVDALNLLYVAFTRARNNLFVFARGHDKKKNYRSPNTLADVLQELLQNPSANGFPGVYTEPAEVTVSTDWTFSMEEDADDFAPEGEEDLTDVVESSYRFGALYVGKTGAGNKRSLLNPDGSDIKLPFRSFPHRTRFRQSNRSVEFSRGTGGDASSNPFADRGKVLHRLFSDIRIGDDVDTALQMLIHEGVINAGESVALRTFVVEALAHPGVSDWYSGKYKLFNECSILAPGRDGKLELKRPDRVMVDQDRVIVVDFKFGKPDVRYRKQVRAYMSLLSGMGYESVEGFLWFVDEGRIEPVSANAATVRA